MGKNRRYTDEFVQKIIDYYVIDSNYTHVAQELKIGVTQVRRIIGKNKDRVVILKKEREPMLDRMFTRIIEKAGKHLEDTLEDAKARDTAIVLGTMYDKRALSRGEPTERLHVETEDELNKRMFRQLQGTKPKKSEKSRIPELANN